MMLHRKQVDIVKWRYRAKHYKNTENNGLRRVLSLLLCLCLLTGVIQIQTMTAFAVTSIDSVSVTYEGESVEKVTLPENERIKLTAECSPTIDNVTYQWQILADIETNLWVNIYGASAQSLSLSYAMLGSLLDESGSGYVRCRATVGDNSCLSDPVCVTVSYNVLNSTVSTAEKTSEKTSAKTSVRKVRARLAAAATPEYVEISINYLDAVTGQPIYTGFTAQIQYGTPYSNSVISPTYLGYAPYYNAANPSESISSGGTVTAYDDATMIYLNVPETYTGSQYVVNVYYKAIDVPYGVRYYFQNINDDLYTEDVGLYRISAAKTGTIISNEELELQDADRAKGFTKLYHYPEAVAADGSTVFQCYYDRNYYMLKFDMAGGYGTDPIYARYGTAFVVNTPTRHGYVFAGWDDITDGEGDGIADTLPDAIPDSNRTYKALWQTVNTTYTTVYWLQNADDDEYSYIGSTKTNAQSGDSVSGSDSLTATTPLCGSDHTHTSDCYPPDFTQYVYEKADTDVTVNGDGSSVVNVYYKRHEYTLHFYYAREKDGVYQVVGGSTYYFGNNSFSRPSTYTVENLLAQEPDTVWGEVKALPTIKEQYKDKLTPGTLEGNGYTYHYLELTARYGADISDSWPGEVFAPAEVSATHTSNGASGNMGDGQWGNYAYLSGWNGEFKVKYTKEHSNSTIKGMFQKLDDNLLYDSDEGTSDVVNFLSFFDNGANISWSIPRQWIYELYVPILEGETAGLTYNGVEYKLLKSIDTSDDTQGISAQTQPTLDGFIAAGSQQINNANLADGRTSYTARFFYSRQSYNLTLHNYNETLSSQRVLYQASLDGYVSTTPPYPSTLEENAYTFDGWYYSPGCYAGSEYKTGDTMPAKNVGLYAKWTPVSHTVRFFRTYDDMVAYETTGDTRGLIDTKTVTHGNVIGTVDNPEDNSGYHYSFGGWFYMKAGNKTAYTPLDMPITKDINVFADWGSHSAQPYRVHYALHDAETDAAWNSLLAAASGNTPQDNKTYTVTNGTEERTYVYLDSDSRYHLLIASDSVGFAYQGNTRTFFPKVGEPLNQLYPAYNNGYFPTLASHSITVAYEENKDEPVNNVFTFTYVHATDISYKVEYRYLDTGLLIDTAPGGGTVNKTSSKAVVTERFAVITDYIPDAFYKRLILVVEKDENGNYVGSSDNVVVFYYSKNTQNAFYAVHHMLQNVDAADDALTTDSDGNYRYYSESDAHTEGIGEIGSTHRVVPQTFSGFTVKETGYIKNGSETSLIDSTTDPHFNITIQQSGTELYIFYTRNTQNYKVYYLAYGTDVSNLSALTYTDGLSNGVLLPIESGTGAFGSTVTASAKSIGGMNCVSSISQTILLRANDEQNYIIFYYSPLQHTVEYKVWAKGGGTLSQTIEVKNGTDQFTGSSATEKSGYRFDGWYLDEGCTVPVGEKGTVTDNTLVPTTLNLDPAPKTNMFYAKFTPVYGDLTIVRENGSGDEGNGDRVFVYRITAADEPDFELFVSVKGSGSVTIKNMLCREYTVEQGNDWSWRYSDAKQSVTVSESGSTVTFDDAPTKNKWLNGNSERIINRKG